MFLYNLRSSVREIWHFFTILESRNEDPEISWDIIILGQVSWSAWPAKMAQGSTICLQSWSWHTGGMGGDNPLLGDVKREEVNATEFWKECLLWSQCVYIYICIFYFYDYTEDGRVSKANFFLQMLHIKINGQQPFLLWCNDDPSCLLGSTRVKVMTSRKPTMHQ